jgi:hypothetical protein
MFELSHQVGMWRNPTCPWLRGGSQAEERGSNWQWAVSRHWGSALGKRAVSDFLSLFLRHWKYIFLLLMKMFLVYFILLFYIMFSFMFNFLYMWKPFKSENQSLHCSNTFRNICLKKLKITTRSRLFNNQVFLMEIQSHLPVLLHTPLLDIHTPLGTSSITKKRGTFKTTFNFNTKSVAYYRSDSMHR